MKPKNVDEYLEAVKDDDQRAALARLRKIIVAAAPGAEECIAYGLAGFRHRGRPLVYFGASAKHCAFYPGGASPTAPFEKDLAGFETSKGTIRFQPDAPLPAALVRKIVKARIAENSALERKRKPRR
jgi:uncharacterized protein YdhG (YjbR/CyaY superfamily)